MAIETSLAPAVDELARLQEYMKLREQPDFGFADPPGQMVRPDFRGMLKPGSRNHLG